MNRIAERAMNRIAERAGALGLFATARVLADARIDPDVAPRDARLAEPVAGDIKRILGQMARRGSDPALVGALWAKLDGRPLERALVAIDVLAQAIWPPREPLLAELRAAASMLGIARPPIGEVGIDLNAHDARSLIDRHSATLRVAARSGRAGPFDLHAHSPELGGATTVELLAQSYEMHLGALDELLRRNDDLLAHRATRDSVHAFARLAALARLPTLASIYFDWLVRGLGWRVPALDLCETLFDAGVAHKIPGTAIRPGDVPELEHRDVAAYCLYRAHLGVGDSDTANALLVHDIAQRPHWRRPPSLRVDVVRAHLGTLYGHGDVTLARVEAACAEDPLWRYGAQVRAIIAARSAPARALELFHGYVASFGNDFDSSSIVLSLVPEDIKRDVARVLCREAYYLPHEPAPWKLLGLLFGVSATIADEIDARIRSQSA